MFLKRIYGDPPQSNLPDGWKIDFLDNFAKRGSGHTPDKKIPEYWNGGIKWVSLADSSKLDQIYIFNTDKEISDLGIANSSAVKHPAGTVIVSRDAGVGKSAILGHEMAVSQHFMAWTCGSNLDNFFLYYTLQFMKPELERMAVGSTIKTIGLRYFEKLQLAFPPLPEQRKIAQILSTWDDAIALVDALITALNDRKKGLMQRLLTGETRFSGFDDEWEEVTIGDLLREVSRPTKWDDDAIYRLISIRRRSGGIFLREEKTGSEIQTKSMNVVHTGDFLISKMQVVHGASALASEEYDGYHISNSYIALRSRSEELFDIRFFDWLSKTSELYHMAYISSNGVHIEKMTFNLKDYFKKFIRVPRDLTEQQKITVVLETVKEITEYLDNYSDNLREQKKGLMQRLLTGAVRVTVD